MIHPLRGLLVADFSRVLAGPLCSQLLADAGARVIKIEEPGRGDETRRWGPPFAGDVAAYFLAINRKKESVTLNLKSRDGKRIAKKLIDRADVVLDNFLQTDLLPKIPKRVVHCHIRGYDNDNAPGYDLLAQAESGLMSITGDPDGEPFKAGVALDDVLTAHYAFGAIASALVARKGAFIEVSLFSSAVASLVNVAQNVLLTGTDAQRYGNAHPSIVPYQVFHASDRPFVVGAGTDRHFQLLCTRVLDRADLAASADYSTNTDRVKRRDALVGELEAEFAARRAAEWVKRCRRAAVPAAVVQSVREALRSDAARGIVDRDVVLNPVMVGGKRRPRGTRAPKLGEHTDRVLRELGYSAKRIDALRSAGVI